MKQCMQIMISFYIQRQPQQSLLFIHLKDGIMLSQPYYLDAVGQALAQSLTFAHQLTSMPCELGFDPTVWDGGYLWYKVFCSHGNVRLHEKFFFLNWHVNICCHFNFNYNHLKTTSIKKWRFQALRHFKLRLDSDAENGSKTLIIQTRPAGVNLAVLYFAARDKLSLVFRSAQDGSAKPKSGICLLVKWTDTTFWLCTAQSSWDLAWGWAQCITSVWHFVCYGLILPANTRRWPGVVLLLGQRRRQWANIETTLGQRLVFVGICWNATQNKP